MATEYHSENSSSFAAGSWSGSGIAADNDYVVETGSIAVTSDLNHTGLTGGIESLTIGHDRTGDIGGPGNPVRCDVDSSSDAFILNLAKAGNLYYKAEGDSNKCEVLTHAGSGGTYIEGGTVDELYQASGYVEANESTVIVDAKLFGGSALFEYNSTGFTSLNIYGGKRTITLRREATVNIYAPVNLVIDIDNETTPTMTLNMFHPQAIVTVLRCDTLATVNRWAGTIDLLPAQRAVSLGGSAFNSGPGTVSGLRTDSRHTIGTITYVGGIRDIGGPMGGGL